MVYLCSRYELFRRYTKRPFHTLITDLLLKCYPLRMLRVAKIVQTILLSASVGLIVAPRSQTNAQNSGQLNSGAPSEPSSQQPAIKFQAGHLSEPYYQVWCPGVFRFTGHQPTWAHGHLAQFTWETTPGEPSAEVYDKQGNIVSEARIWFPDALQIRLIDAVPSADGGVVASGNAETTEGSTSFIAKTDVSGAVVSLLRNRAIAGRVCEARDGTIWTFERDMLKESANEYDYPLVQQYDFEKGLLHSYLSRNLVALDPHGAVGGGGPGGSFLVCGKDRILLYLNQTNEYVEIAPSTQGLQRWKMEMTPLPQAKVTGLDITENGHVYASLYEVQTETQTKTHGLFELQREPGNATAKWIAFPETLNSHREGEAVPANTFWRLWGAEGDDLIIGREYDAEFSWVHVIR